MNANITLPVLTVAEFRAKVIAGLIAGFAEWEPDEIFGYFLNHGFSKFDIEWLDEFVKGLPPMTIDSVAVESSDRKYVWVVSSTGAVLIRRPDES